LIVNREHCFKDKYLFYRFTMNDFSVPIKNNINERKLLEEQLQDTILLLGNYLKFSKRNKLN
jgi:hypothetical protein